MGIRSTRPLPLAHAELALSPSFKRRFRSWHLEHVRLALQRYRRLTTRFCVDALQLSAILGIKEKPLVDDVMRLFLPRTPTRVQCMVDVMEVLVALVLVCQAPSMLQRFELIFDIVDLEGKGAISTTDLILLCGAVGRAVMKLFECKVEPEQQAAMAYVTDVLDALGVGKDGSIGKMALCKFMLSDRFAVHYVKQCTGDDKPKLYIMMEKDAEFLGAVEFSNEQQMQMTSLRTVRDMIYAQVHRVPDDFVFLCQGRQVEKVWEVDRRAWSIVPFALRGSPGLRTDILAKNRSLERPSVASPFEFRYMGNLITRYKKRVHEIKPVYKHRGFRLRKNAPRKRLEPRLQWRVATTWSGEWIYEQQLIQKKSKSEVLKSLRTAACPEEGVFVVKSHFGEILSPCSMIGAGDEALADDLPLSLSIEDTPPALSQPEKRMQRIVAMNLRERKHEDKLRKQGIRWKARLLAMEAQHQMDEQRSSLTEAQQRVSSQHKHAVPVSKTAGIKTVLVHVEEDNILPSRIVHCEPKKRRRPKKLEWSTCRWDIPGRLLSSLPPRCKKMKVSKISDDMSLATPVATSTNRQLGLGRFLSSTHIFLDDNEVEVFPVLILRPVEEQVCVNDRVDGVNEDAVLPTSQGDAEKIEEILEEPLFASKSYLTEFEYEITATESNFEALYQHVASGTLHDAVLLNRRDVFGRTMLHDAAEFGHANVMELLLKARVIVDIQDSRGDTPLHHAARHGRLKEVSLLLREHATPWLLNAEGKSPLYCALETAARRSSVRSVSPSEGKSEAASNSNSLDGNKNFFLAHRSYPQLRQVIDLLWDCYKLEHIVKNDGYDRSNCLELEKHVYGDMIQSCHDGNLLRVQRLVDLEKRPLLRYVNDQMKYLNRTALHEATEQGHTATVDLLLKLGADGSLRDQRLQAPLHLAAWKGYDKIVKCLVSKFPLTVAYQDVTGCTPLHLAIQHKRWSIALELISLAKANGEADLIGGFNVEGQRANCLDLQDIHGYTSLHYACVHGCFEVCEALVNAGAAVSVSQCEYRIEKGASHLMGVWWKGDLKHIGNRKSLVAVPDQCKVVDIEAPVEMLIQGCKQDLSNLQERQDVLQLLVHHEHAVDSTQGPRDLVKVSASPLFHIAAQLADTNISVAVEVCRRLHKLQVEINMPHPQTKETVLLQECRRVCTLTRGCSGTKSPENEMTSQLALIRSLLELGANVDLANETNGESPLGCAAWYGHLALLDLLLEAGADKDGFLRRCSFSPLHFAALGNNVACAKMLIGRSAIVNVELPPSNAETPLYFAIRSRSEAMVDLLLRSNADPCSLCTVQQDRSTSFGIVLSHPTEVERGRGIHSKTLDTQREAVSPIVSPLTFGLLVSRSLRVFGVPEELNCTVERCQKHTEWGEMKRICIMLAKRLLEENDGSKGVVSREDVHLASVLGFWELVELLLTQQVALSNAPSSNGLNALHLAAAAGQTKVVTALVAGGMDVNCSIRNDSWQRKKATGRRVWYEWIGCGHKGALFYALIHGHTETAAKLLVLGASAEQTIPHSRKTIRWRLPKVFNDDKEFCEKTVARFIVSEAMAKAARTDHLERRIRSSPESGSGRGRMDEAEVNLIHLIECSVNQKVPLLHLVVALGHFTLVKKLVGAGMSIFSGFVAPPPTDESSMSGINAPAETPIHLAIACGHLEIVKYFASKVQNRFPGCFVRDGKAFQSLLVTACESHQASILRFLLGHNESDGGGGFSYDSCKDEFQSALSACASVQFVEGFELLVQSGATPDVHSLVSTLRGITQKARHPMAGPRVNEIEMLEREDTPCQPAFRGERYQHDYRKNSVEVATTLLHKILSPEYIRDISNFIGTSPVYELMQTILIICSRYQLWFVFDQIFVRHQEDFVDAASIWKPVLVRAASSSLILHRAAIHNQTNVIAFFLRLGVPANVRISQLPPSRNPTWYAATRGSLEAFLCLVLHLSPFMEELECCRVLNALPLTFRSIEESRSNLSTSNTTCRWQNLCVFGCIDLPKRQTNGYLIQKFINYGLQMSRGHVDTSLLHHACRRGELIAVQALVDAGADLAATNRKGETPLEVASGRKDSFAVSIVRYLLSALTHNQVPSTANIMDRALVCCFAQGGPCNLMVAQALLDGGASARYSWEPANDEVKASDVAQISAMFYAMQMAQLAGVKLLLDHGAVITVRLSEVFLSRFLMESKPAAQSHWRRFARLVKYNSGKALLLDVEGVMKILLEKSVFAGAMNSDLVHQMLTSAAALASTIAQEVGVAKRFWDVVKMILDRYPKEISSQKAEWNQKSALHYAVSNKEVQIVSKLLGLRSLDLLAMDENKQTPLHLAAAGGDETVCRLLLAKLQSNSAKTTAIDVPDIHGRTALHLAVIHGHEAVASMLLAAGASVEIRCHDGLTALLYAAKCNRLAILIALFSQSLPKSRGALLSANGDAGLFVAAQYGAFAVVRWFMNLHAEADGQNTSSKTSVQEESTLRMHCSLGRTILHYAALYGDEETVRLLLKLARHDDDSESSTSTVQDLVNARDNLGYTPLMFAFAFGKLRVVRMLCEVGADPYASIDHSGDAGAHPYTVSFDISGLQQWFALPGWYSFACKYLPPEEKPRLVHASSIEDDYLSHSSYNYRNKRGRPPVEWRCKWQRIPAARLLKSEPRHRGKQLTRSSIRSWRFPQKTIFDFACEIGNGQMVEFLVNLRLPQIFRSLSYQAQRRNFLQAVRWNRLDVVKILVASAAPGNMVIESTTGNHFLDFLEAGIECSISRGLEDMAIYLVNQWRGIKENGVDSATPSAFAFQFASAFQVACIRKLPRLMERMIERGGEQLVEFHLNEGPALVYAFAFGNVDIAALLLRNGADPSLPTATYSVPSIRKWVEFGSSKDVRVSWQPRADGEMNRTKRPAFVGPLEVYDAPAPRLTLDELCRTFTSISVTRVPSIPTDRFSHLTIASDPTLPGKDEGPERSEDLEGLSMHGNNEEASQMPATHEGSKAIEDATHVEVDSEPAEPTQLPVNNESEPAE